MMTDVLIEALTYQAAVHFPNEACGFITHDGELLPQENIHHNPQQSFLIDPLAFMQQSGRIMAVYHSHPNASPLPSTADIASAERCNLPFVIISYPGGDLHSYMPRGVLPAPYEGRPFVYGVLDCLNLVADYYRQEFNLDIQDGERKCWNWWQDPANQTAFVEGFKQRGFVQVEAPLPGDVIIMQLQGACPNHAAIYLGDNRILHHPGQNNLSRAEMYGHYWRQRTACILRHPNA
jgi:cell wall-associated NlpC family hydrolase